MDRNKISDLINAIDDEYIKKSELPIAKKNKRRATYYKIALGFAVGAVFIALITLKIKNLDKQSFDIVLGEGETETVLEATENYEESTVENDESITVETTEKIFYTKTPGLELPALTPEQEDRYFDLLNKYNIEVDRDNFCVWDNGVRGCAEVVAYYYTIGYDNELFPVLLDLSDEELNIINNYNLDLKEVAFDDPTLEIKKEKYQMYSEITAGILNDIFINNNDIKIKFVKDKEFIPADICNNFTGNQLQWIVNFVRSCPECGVYIKDGKYFWGFLGVPALDYPQTNFKLIIETQNMQPRAMPYAVAWY